MINVVIPVEIPNRELMFKTILGIKLARKGLRCHITLKHNLPRLVAKLSPVVYIDKGYHLGVSEPLHKQIKDGGGIIVGLDEEGAADFEGFPFVETRYPDYVFEEYDQIYIWGQRQYNHLKKLRSKFDQNKAFVTGHPRFEYLRRYDQSSVFPETSELGRKYGKIILVNMNSGFGNNLKGDDHVRSNYGSRIKNLATIMQYDKIKVQETIKLVKELCEQTKQKIVVRPHPEESFEVYKTQLSSEIAHGKCFLTNQYAVTSWILICSHIVHADSTSAIEALLMGKDPVSYLPPDANKVATYLPVAISTMFEKRSAVVDYINSGADCAKLQEHLDHLEGFINTQESEELIVDHLQGLVEKHPQLKHRQKINLFDRLYFVAKTFKRKTLHQKDKLSKQKSKGMNREIVRKYAEMVSAEGDTTIKMPKINWVSADYFVI